MPLSASVWFRGESRVKLPLLNTFCQERLCTIAVSHPAMPTPPPSRTAFSAVKQWHIPGRTVAAPSWVMPGTVLENCHVLAPLADEVGILFFETDASLAAGAAELPPELATFPLSYHVHLPVDLPMHQPEQAARIAAALVHKLAFLGVQQAVVHPPAGEDAPRLVQRFVQAFVACQQGITLLWENTKHNSLLGIAPVLLALDQRICLDIGHLLAYEQESLLLAPALLAQVAMVHLNAPGDCGQPSRHACLSTLSTTQKAVAKAALAATSQQAVLMFELFRLEEVETSVPLVRQWLECTP